MGVYQDIGEKFEGVTQALISQSISAIIHEITPVITIGVIIYLMITGYMIIAGRISEPISDILIKGVKIILVATVALNASTLMTVAVNGISGLEEMFSNAISGNSGQNIYQILDDNFDKGMRTAAEIMAAIEDLAWYDFGDAIALFASSLIVLIATILITILAGCMYIMTKISLAVVLGLSPFFIAGLFFPMTARWFDSWLSQAVNFALTGAIIVFFSSLAFSSFADIATEIITKVQSDIYFPAKEMGYLIIHSLVCYMAMKQAPSIASGLAGGLGISAGSSLSDMVAKAGTGAMSKGWKKLFDRKPPPEQPKNPNNQNSSQERNRAKLLDRLRGNSMKRS